MTKAELIEKLKLLSTGLVDEQQNHVDADELLLEFIGDKEVRAAFEAVPKWYA